jgi:hypothetical protein
MSVYQAFGGFISYSNKDDYLSNECDDSSLNPSKERGILTFFMLNEAHLSKNADGNEIQLKYSYSIDRDWHLFT